ncbi:MAG TPA: RNA-binding S4 domain-containing protein [Acidimicrobiales bacterium]
MREVAIRDEMIRLGQLLKLSGLADEGSDAKVLLAGGDVTVDGTVERRRGRQLFEGSVVSVDGEAIVIAAAADVDA